MKEPVKTIGSAARSLPTDNTLMGLASEAVGAIGWIAGPPPLVLPHSAAALPPLLSTRRPEVAGAASSPPKKLAQVTDGLRPRIAATDPRAKTIFGSTYTAAAVARCCASMKGDRTRARGTVSSSPSGPHQAPSKRSGRTFGSANGKRPAHYGLLRANPGCYSRHGVLERPLQSSQARPEPGYRAALCELLDPVARLPASR